MKNELLVICGPTATGKTSLGIRLAKKLGGEIVSADARQVYKGMDIGTGKDLPKGSKLEKSPIGSGFYTVEGVKIWGYDLVNPTQEFSVAQYAKIARKIIKTTWQEEKLPILVGGTGLYIKGVVDGIGTAKVPRNKKLRVLLEELSTKGLFERLAQISPVKAANMNASDRKNPRRLVRAIEIADWETREGRVADTKEKEVFAENVLMLGLRSPTEMLCKKIKRRVEKRLQAGFEEEVKSLLERRGVKKSQAITSLGYQQWKDYLEGSISRKEAIDLWAKSECKYAKRQMSWFKKDKRIQWTDVTSDKYPQEIEKFVQRWYSSLDA